MKKHPVVFIANNEYGNLGTGYMSALLLEAGFKSFTVSIDEKKKNILSILERTNPIIVGFSVIHHNYIDRFTRLIGFLREKGCRCHFTAGGHYATLNYEELLGLAPNLDSIVRFEGEETIRELAETINAGKDWKKTRNLVYMNNNEIIVNPPGPPVKDLDQLPFPVRPKAREYALGMKYATILAGRGCIYDCSFCNLREFYRPFTGISKRIRNPDIVATEMEYLYREKGCSVFLFQDDDFPVKAVNRPQWTEEFCNAILGRRLPGKIMWKISCRPDEIEKNQFRMMKDHGLFLVFLGIEDGTDAGLKKLNKHTTVEKSLAGLKILKELCIDFDFGFMLFQPSTTFRSLNENLEFLEGICGDGYSPVTIMKLIPFYKTRIEKELLEQGRMTRTGGKPDYLFAEEMLNKYFEFINGCFSGWTGNRDGLYNICKWARNYTAVYRHCFGSTEEYRILSENVREIISGSNLLLLNTLRELSDIFQSGKMPADQKFTLRSFRKRICTEENNYKRKLNNVMYALLSDYKRRRMVQTAI